MLTELIAAGQKSAENGNGNGEDIPEEDEEPDDELGLAADSEPDEDAVEELSAKDDHGAVRRYRFRHPTASGKTIAAAARDASSRRSSSGPAG